MKKTAFISGFINSIVICASLLGSQVYAMQGSLLNLALGYPRVNTALDANTVCAYDATAQTLTIETLAQTTDFTVTGPTGFIINSTQTGFGQLSFVANIDNAGNLLPGGTFSVTGTVSDGTTSYGPTLLSGTIDEYGIVDLGAQDQADFRIMGVPTGGDLLALYPPGDVIGMFVALEFSTYAGTFATDWSCTSPKPVVGPTPGVNLPVCDLSLTKTVDPTEIGPIIPPGDDSDSDTDSDSGHDRNGNGNSDDSDTDSGDSDHGGDSGSLPVDCGCAGKVDELVMQYNGTQAADILVTGRRGHVIFQGTVNPGDQFTLSGYDRQNTLGPAIWISIDGGATVDIHTSCSRPIGPGLIFGDFEVISGMSRRLSVPLCPFVDGQQCPLNQFVTYTYVVTNNGDPVADIQVVDDKLGAIGTSALLGTGQSVTFTESACLFETTTNIATATGSLGSESCPSSEATATVELLLPPDPGGGCNPGGDTDSDSGLDNDYTGDTDDSDSDSGDCDNDGDSDIEPISYEGCGPRYWKKRSHFDSWTELRPGNKFERVFDVNAAGNKSLLKVLKHRGGRSKALGRHAVSAMLNALSPDVNYLFSAQEVTDIVQNAYATWDFRTAKNLLKEQNRACSLN